MDYATSFIKHLTVVATLCLVLTATTNGQSLDLNTSQVNIADKNKITLEHLFFDNNFYNVNIQLNLNGTYLASQVESISLTPTATYQVTFTSTWSQQSHPYEYPAGLVHFSGLIGATHNALVDFWQPKEMQQVVSKTWLKQEANHF